MTTSRIFLIALLAPTLAHASPLPLSQYLDQVNHNHQGVQSSRALARGAKLRSEVPSLMFGPQAFAELGTVTDKRETINPSFQGTRTDAGQWQVGIRQQTPFGLAGSLGYLQNHTKIHQATLVNPADFYTASPFVEFRLPLWRNAFGSENRAQRDAAQAAELVSHFAENYKSQAIVAEAQMAYWRLALARESVALQEEVLSRSQKLVEWAERRTNLQLGDESDLLQARSVREIRRMDLKTLEADLLVASRAFNASRGVDSDRVGESLDPIEPQSLQKLQIPSRTPGTRGDTLAFGQQHLAAIAKVEAQLEELKPNLEVFGNYSWNGRDAKRSIAADEAQKSKNSYSAVGVRFSTPLSFGTLSDARGGSREQAVAAELAWERKKFEEERDWNDLLTRFAQARSRLTHALQIEEAQRKKYDHEQKRLVRGRTTTYQTLVFEQDYTQSQLLRVRTEAEILQLWAQLQLFRGDE